MRRQHIRPAVLLTAVSTVLTAAAAGPPAHAATGVGVREVGTLAPVPLSPRTDYVYRARATGFPHEEQGTSGYLWMAAVGDLNRDDHDDLVARDRAGNLWRYVGNGRGGYGPRTRIGTGWNGFTTLS